MRSLLAGQRAFLNDCGLGAREAQSAVQLAREVGRARCKCLRLS